MNYYLGRFISFVVFKFFYQLKIFGKKTLPETGFLIASNHNSVIDPPLVGACLKQPVYFMAKKELFEIPIFGALIRSTHAFPVRRGTPELSSIKKAIRLLKSGKVLLVFPEGTRKSTQKIYSGVSLLAHKAGVPVVPSRIYNNDKVNKLAPLKYVIGKPLKFELPPEKRASGKLYEQFAARIMEEIDNL